jgi:hypothetical protein
VAFQAFCAEKPEQGIACQDCEVQEAMKKEALFGIVLALVVIAITFYGQYRPYEGKITHDFPVTINAADPGSRVSDAENVLLTGRTKFEPPWYALELPGRIQAYPPMMLVLVAGLSEVSGIEIFDLYFFVGVMVFAGIALGWFLYFRKCWNKPWIGMIAGLLLAYPFEPFNHFLLKIGIYSNFFVALFFPYVLIAFDRFVKQPSWKNIAFFGLISGMQFLTHPSANVPFIGFLLLYALIVHRKNVGWKKIIIAGLVYTLVAMPYVPLFTQTFVLANKESGAFKIKTAEQLKSPAWEPNVDFTNLLHPVLYFFALLGLVIALLRPEFRIPAVVALFFVFYTMILTQFGIGEYYLSVRTRYLLFAFLYPFVALGLFTALQGIVNSVPVVKSLDRKKVYAIITLFLLIFVVVTVKKVPEEGPRMFAKEKYDDFLWVRQNTPEESVVLCLGCQQFEGFVTRRVVLQPMYWDSETINSMVQLATGNTTGNRLLGTEYTGHSEAFPLQTGPFTYELAKFTKNITSYAKRDICIADYVIVMGHPQLTQVFQAIGSNLLAKNASVVRQSQYMVILKNNNKDGDCI